MNLEIKELREKHPLLGKLLRMAKQKSFFKASYKKIINGRRNKFKIDISSLFIGCKFDIIGDYNEIIIEKASFFNNVIFYIRGNNNVIWISNNVEFHNRGTLWIEDENCVIKIGEHSTFEDVHIAVTEPNSKITIGDNCMFANDIDVRTGDSHSIIDSTTMKRINYAKNIEIDNHVWIASHVSVLKGVRILKNSVVATRSVVTKSFMKEGILIGGVPAKVLKNNITWNRKRIY